MLVQQPTVLYRLSSILSHKCTLRKTVQHAEQASLFRQHAAYVCLELPADRSRAILHGRDPTLSLVLDLHIVRGWSERTADDQLRYREQSCSLGTLRC